VTGLFNCKPESCSSLVQSCPASGAFNFNAGCEGFQIYCAIGGRARRAAEKMSKLGYKEILLPKGSFTAWKEAGKPIEGGKK